MAEANAEVDWGEYFIRIQTVCPWSLTAWNQNRILITTWDKPRELAPYQAIVYVANLLIPQLKAQADQLESQDTECEWLWSHPQGGGPYSTPVPCLIQQDRKFIDNIRSRINI